MRQFYLYAQYAHVYERQNNILHSSISAKMIESRRDVFYEKNSASVENPFEVLKKFTGQR